MKPLVFVAEDSRFYLSVVRWGVVDRLGFDMIHATTLAETRTMLAERGPEVYVALLDLNLPDAPRGEVIDVVAKYDIPSIVFTGTFTDEIREFILTKGVVDYIPKDTPNGIETVLDLIRRLGKNGNCGILVVDDSRVSRDLLGRLLKLHRFKVIEANDGPTALKVLDEHPEIVLAIVDYNMPGMNGCELTRRLRAKRDRDSLAIIGLSAYGNNVVSAKFMKSGANDYLNKPFVAEELFCRLYQNITQIEAIAELRANHEQLSEAASKALAANDAKTRFLSQMSHELRTPLNAVIGFSQLLLADPVVTGDGTRLQRVERILHAGEHLLELVNDALDIARVEAGRADLAEARCDLAEICSEVAGMVTVDADKRKVAFSVAAEIPVPVVADHRRLLQVAINLVANGLKFTPAGGSVTLRTGVGDDGRPYLCVKDTGIGMDAAGIEAAFEPFGQSGDIAKRREGTGLGIPLAKAFAEAHGGALTLESAPGAGTTATMWLAASRRIGRGVVDGEGAAAS